MPRTVVDYRLGGVPIRRIVPDDWEGFVRLPDEYLRCVVFLGRKTLDPVTKLEREVLIGTAFFVALEVAPGANMLCLVTARHVARQITDGAFFVRMNTKAGKAENYWLDGGVDAHWIYHETDESVDAGVLLWAPPPEADFLALGEVTFVTRENVTKKRIGIGDEVYVTGLFSFHRGKGRNEPIVRCGHIAMMPRERIPVPDWHKDGIEGYLIEGRSIGGFSGSPVFVQRSIKVQATEETGRAPLAGGAIFWLGIMHGHWNASPDDVDSVSSGDEHEARINAGIAITVPCHKVVEIFEQKVIRAAAVQALCELERLHPAILDGTSGSAVKRGKEDVASRYVTMSAASSAANFTPSKLTLDSLHPRRGAIPSEPAADTPDGDLTRFTKLLGAAAKRKPPAA